MLYSKCNCVSVRCTCSHQTLFRVLRRLKKLHGSPPASHEEHGNSARREKCSIPAGEKSLMAIKWDSCLRRKFPKINTLRVVSLKCRRLTNREEHEHAAAACEHAVLLTFIFSLWFARQHFFLHCRNHVHLHTAFYSHQFPRQCRAIVADNGWYYQYINWISKQ